MTEPYAVMTRRRAILAGMSSVLVTAPLWVQDLWAQERRPQRLNTPPTYPMFQIPPSTHSLTQHDVTVDGQGYRIFIATPKSTAPMQGWPSLWMLDGNSAFNRLSAADLEAHPDLAVIGIGYQVDQSFDTTARALDYTPTSLVADPERGRGRATGGADAFRARLTGPLRDAVDGHIRLDPARRVLWGHSYGGLFTLYCLLTQPNAFAGWAPTSPSSGFGGGVLRSLIADAPHSGRTGAAPVRIAPVRIMLGDSEHRNGTEAPPEPRPSPETIALADMLKTRNDLDVSVTVFKGLGHGQTFAASFPMALDLAAAI